MMYSTILESVPSILVNLLLGAWSDSRGRKKPLMVLPFVGHMIAASILALNVYFAEAKAEYMLLYTLYAFCGGEKRVNIPSKKIYT